MIVPARVATPYTYGLSKLVRIGMVTIARNRTNPLLKASWLVPETTRRVKVMANRR
jgi:hypothetical protein